MRILTGIELTPIKISFDIVRIDSKLPAWKPLFVKHNFFFLSKPIDTSLMFKYLFRNCCLVPKVNLFLYLSFFILKISLNHGFFSLSFFCFIFTTFYTNYWTNVMARKAFFENLYEKGPGTLIEDDVVSGYDLFVWFVFQFRRSINIFKFEHFD